MAVGRKRIVEELWVNGNEGQRILSLEMDRKLGIRSIVSASVGIPSVVGLAEASTIEKRLTTSNVPTLTFVTL